MGKTKVLRHKVQNKFRNPPTENKLKVISSIVAPIDFTVSCTDGSVRYCLVGNSHDEVRSEREGGNVEKSTYRY